tara:strand:- start:6417 stop:7133 length:717 start_codon:yes stop_codon:yes gene_type:complete
LYTALIQARTSSKRLKSKVLMKILNQQIFLIVYKRTLKSELIDKAIIVTSKSKSDDIIETICKKKNIPIFRGSLNNVLKRYYDCSKKNLLNDVVRITSDCPLIDPNIITKLCNAYKAKKVQYASNIINPTFPDGFDVEIFSFDLLKKTLMNSKSKKSKEHVTLDMLKNDNIKKYNLKNKINLSKYRLTLDTYQDYLKIKKIFQKYKSIYKPDLKSISKIILNDKKRYFQIRPTYQNEI